jgi:photosystem II stability/assembly factor-like uncharacterized protein
LHYTPVQEIGLADGGVGWAADESDIYLTTDQGRTWRMVTPSNLANQAVPERIGAMDAIGESDLWLVLTDVPGLPPPSALASDRGSGIDRSTDGGQTWTFSALPGCFQTCGANLSLSFVDPEHGFATIGPLQSGPTLLYSTDDGGATWTQMGELPNLGGMLVGGPGPGAQILFTSALDGWAVTGPTEGSSGQETSPGGTVYRTTDGGVSWSPAPGLPANEQYSLPTFFGAQAGVMLSNPEGAPSQSSSVYVTDDGGNTWTSHPVPTIAGLASFKPGGIGFRFATISPVDWRIDTGLILYSTNNAGDTWTRSVPMPESGAGGVTSIVYSSPQNAMAMSLPPACSEPVSAAQTFTQCLPSLTVSTDGGMHWVPVTP